MIGIFLVNTQGQICMARYDVGRDDPDIAELVYLPGSRIAAVTLADGTESVLVNEIDPKVHQAMVSNGQILIANLDFDSKPIREYTVPLKKR